MKRSEFKNGVQVVHVDMPNTVLTIYSTTNHDDDFTIEEQKNPTSWAIVNLMKNSIRCIRHVGGVRLYASIKLSHLKVIE